MTSINDSEECDGGEGCSEDCSLSGFDPLCAISANGCPLIYWIAIQGILFIMGSETTPNEEFTHPVVMPNF